MAPNDDGEHGRLDWGPEDFAAAWGKDRDLRWWEEEAQDEAPSSARRRHALLRGVALLVAVALCLGTIGTWIEIAVGGSQRAVLSAAVDTVTAATLPDGGAGLTVGLRVTNASEVLSAQTRCTLVVEHNGRTVVRASLPNLGALAPGQVVGTSVQIALPGTTPVPAAHAVQVSC